MPSMRLQIPCKLPLQPPTTIIFSDDEDRDVLVGSARKFADHDGVGFFHERIDESVDDFLIIDHDYLASFLAAGFTLALAYLSMMPLRLNMARTLSLGVAPLLSHFKASSSLISAFSSPIAGSKVPICSM